MSKCPSCAYPATQSSRNAHGVIVCPECGHPMQTVRLSDDDRRAIDMTHSVTQLQGARGVGLGGFISLALVVYMFEPRMAEDLHALRVLGGASLIMLLLAHLMIESSLRGRRQTRTSRLHLGWGLLAFTGYLIAKSFAWNSDAAVLARVLIQVSLFAGVFLLLWDLRDRAFRFPIESVGLRPRVRLSRAIVLIVATGLVYNACTLVVGPGMEQAWATLMALTAILLILITSQYAQSLGELHRGSSAWADTIEVDQQNTSAE